MLFTRCTASYCYDLLVKCRNTVLFGPYIEREDSHYIQLWEQCVRDDSYRPLSRNAETKDFARLTSHPVRGWTGKNKAFCSSGIQNGRRVMKVYCSVACLTVLLLPNNNGAPFDSSPIVVPSSLPVGVGVFLRRENPVFAFRARHFG